MAVEPGEERLEPALVDRLHQVVVGAQPQRLDRGVDRGVAGDQDDLDAGLFAELGEDLHALAVGQHHVAEHDVGALALELPPRFGERRRLAHREPFELDQRRQRSQRQRIVLDHQRLGFGALGFAVRSRGLRRSLFVHGRLEKMGWHQGPRAVEGSVSVHL